jgi:hypothetical protein
MKIIPYLFVFGSLTFTISCLNSSQGDVTELNLKFFGEAIVLNQYQDVTPGSEEDPGNPYRYTVFADTLVLVNNQGTVPWFLDIYNLNDGKLIRRLAHKGRGPGEFISFYTKFNSETDKSFFVFDNLNIYLANTDSLLKNHALIFNDTLCGYDNLCSRGEIAKLGEKKYLLKNKWYIDVREYNPDNLPEFYIHTGKSSKDSLPMVNSDNYIYYPWQVNYQLLFNIPGRDEVWIADCQKDMIRIFNNEMKTIKIIKGPYGITPKYSLFKVPGTDYQFVQFEGDTKYATFSDFAITKNYVYLVCQKTAGTDALRFEKELLPDSEILKFDLTGGPVARYLPGKYIQSISVSSDEKFLFCTAKDSFSGTVKLLKYKLQ